MQQKTRKLGGMIRNWLADEAGNATIDWVVLVASITAMTIVVMIAIGGGLTTFSDNAETELTQREVGFE